MTRRCGRLAWALGLLVVLAPTAQAVEQEIHGDPLPPGAIARLGSARLRHAGLSSLVFAPDGKTLFSGGDNVICVWDVTTGKEKHSWPGVDQGWGGALALTPDGKTLAVEGRGNAVHLLDAATGKEIRRFIGVEGTAVRGVALSPDVKFVGTP